MYKNTYVEVDLDIIGNNVKQIIDNYKDYQYYFGNLSGNAYGHDSYIVNSLVDNGINYIMASTLEEAINIRKWNNNIPILCLTPIPVEYIDICLQNNITITIHDYYYFSELINIKINGSLKIHLKIDSGINNIGLKDKYELKDIVDDIKEKKYFILEGIYTELLTDNISRNYFDCQIQNFKDITKLINLDEFSIIHLGNTDNLLFNEKIKLVNSLNIGIEMYGYKTMSTEKTDIKTKIMSYYNKIKNKDKLEKPLFKELNLNLKPSFVLYSEVIQIKELKKGEVLGINYKIKNKTLLATIPIGYIDGISEELTKSFVSINNQKYKIVGIIDTYFINVIVDESVSLHDKVTIMGNQINITSLSKIINVPINKILININKNIPRVFIKDDKIKKIINYN